MNIPGFSADRSLYKGAEQYRLTRKAHVTGSSRIEPASFQWLEPGPICHWDCIWIKGPDGRPIPTDICKLVCFWPNHN
jgi:hypothetical protein